MKTVRVHTNPSYEVNIQAGLLSQAGGWCALCGKVMLVTDDNVYPLYGAPIEQALASRGLVVKTHIVKNGETAKSAENFFAILSHLAQAQFSRSDRILALGGGVVGDLAGFAAASYMRGIPYAQVPTTLLAAIDSSVGGKTGVNLPEGKNLAGAFHQPVAVYCDPLAFLTLPAEVYASGLAEAIKYGVLFDEALFAMLETESEDIEEIIFRCVSHKRDVVEADEKDLGQRQLLNFGHTIGHAIESVSRYAYSHGQAVAIGMVREARAAFRLGLCERDLSQEIKESLQKHTLPVNCAFADAELAGAIRHDKKAGGAGITIIVPKHIGEAELKLLPFDQIEEYVRMGRE